MLAKARILQSSVVMMSSLESVDTWNLEREHCSSVGKREESQQRGIVISGRGWRVRRDLPARITCVEAILDRVGCLSKLGA